MTLRHRTTILIAIAVSALACSSSTTDDKNAGAATFKDTIEESFTRNRIKLFFDDRRFGPLLHDAEFRNLYRQSTMHEAAARSLVTDSSVSLKTKSVVVLLMQCLPIDRYVEFVRLIFDETKAGRVDPALLAESIRPGDDWGDVLAMNYLEPRARELLETIRTSQVGGAQVGDRITWILDGRTAKYFRDHQADGVPMPSIDCEARN